MDNPFLGCSDDRYLLDCGQSQGSRTLARYDYYRSHRNISISFRRCRHSWLLFGQSAICRRSLFSLAGRLVRDRVLASHLVLGFPRLGEWSPPWSGSLVRDYWDAEPVRFPQWRTRTPQLGLGVPDHVGCILDPLDALCRLLARDRLFLETQVLPDVRDRPPIHHSWESTYLRYCRSECSLSHIIVRGTGRHSGSIVCLVLSVCRAVTVRAAARLLRCKEIDLSSSSSDSW